MPSLDTSIPGLDRLPIVGILRGCPADHATRVAAAAAEAGLIALEVTLDSEDALAQIRSIAGLGPTVGVGTVTDAGQVGPAVEAGARFVVSPIVDPDVITECAQRGVPCLPGAATPTEIHHALELGATGVKVFPALQLGGPGYLRAIRGPLGHPPLVPTGGVDLGNAADFLDAGAVALGVGSSMFPRRALVDGAAGEIGEIVAAWVGKIGR